MNKEERKLCKSVLERTKVGKIIWQAEGKYSLIDSFITKIDGLDLRIGYNVRRYSDGGSSRDYWLDVRNGEGATRLVQDSGLFRPNPLREIFEFLRDKKRSEEKARETATRNRLTAKLAAKLSLSKNTANPPA